MKFKKFLAAAVLTVGSLCHAAVPVLIYHQISDTLPPSETVISLAKFSQQMAYLAGQGYTTLSMDELVAVMQGRQSLPEKPIVLTFDDGYKDVLLAVPVLNKYNFKASFWLITGPLQEGHPLYLDWASIKKLVQNPRFEVQSHSVTHPWDYPVDTLQSWAEGKTPRKGLADVRSELAASKHVLETGLGRPVNYFAWPLGLYNDEMVQMAKEVGYKALLTVDDRAPNIVGGDVFKIKRMNVGGACDMKSFIAQLVDFRARNCPTKRSD